MEQQETYRIRTNVGEEKPINIPVNLTQNFKTFEVLSLKLNMDGEYRKYTSNTGIIVGRVTTANNGLGIPNVRVSVFVPRGMHELTEKEMLEYPFMAVTDTNNDRVRYNLLPSTSDIACYQVVGTLPTKERILNNETICKVFDKFYTYTTITNEAGDYMLTGIPVGNQRLHIDMDLSDIGTFLSQKPRDMINNLGIDKNKFDSPTKFKQSKDLDSLAQILSQNKSVYVYPYWGDSTEENEEMLKLTRCDLAVNYEFKTSCVFLGSVVTDQKGHYISKNCTPNNGAGRMDSLVTGNGTIEMIRKTLDNKIEQHKIQGDQLINENGVWCYSIPMNLDYVKTDEFGNIVPTDDPSKGIPTRARVRFRFTLNDMGDENDNQKRCKFLVPNNPRIDDPHFQERKDADYDFGSATEEDSFIDLFWNKVYTVKSYIPSMKKDERQTNRNHGGIKGINHYGDNNPMPYNNLSIKLSVMHRLICVIIKILIGLVGFLNGLICTLLAPFCWLKKALDKIANSLCIKIWKWKICPLKPLFSPLVAFCKLFLDNIRCVALSENFCDDGINSVKTYPGCGVGLGSLSPCAWESTKADCDKEQYKKTQKGELPSICTNSTHFLDQCVENSLAQENDATNFNFNNDWVNGVLYMPMWMRYIKPKRKFFFGLFSRRAKDQWCSADKLSRGTKIVQHCNVGLGIDSSTDKCDSDSCGVKHSTAIPINHGVIRTKETMLGQTVYYYRAIEYSTQIEDVSVVEEKDKGHIKNLFATDIVLLGSLNDCDLNGVPQFFKFLTGSTYNMPTDLLLTDWTMSYSFEENAKGEVVTVNQTQTALSESSGCDWGNSNSEGGRGGLFYGIGCSSYETYTSSCVNLRRICELGVGLDATQIIPDTSDINSVDTEDDKDMLLCDGYVSYDELYNLDARSMFATMNGNHLKTKHNEENGLYEYDFQYLYPENFDGANKRSMNPVPGDVDASFKNNGNLETESKDYIRFRLGEKPYFYDVAKTFPRYENSFYFYFGLKSGKTAIDKFNELYYAPCESAEEAEPSISIFAQANSWTTDRTAYASGSIKIDVSSLSGISSIIINSEDDKTLSYEVKDEFLNADVILIDGNAEKLIQYGGDGEDGCTSQSGCSKKMVSNGRYTVTIGDTDGNYYTYSVTIEAPKTVYSLNNDNFEFTIIQLKKKLGDNYYEGICGATPTLNPIDFKFDTESHDRTGMGGTVTIINPIVGGEYLEDFKVEISGIYKESEDATEQYKVEGSFFAVGQVAEEGTMTIYKKGVTENDDAYVAVATQTISVANNNDGIKFYYSFGVPFPNVKYNVKITQMNGATPTLNVVTKSIFVGEPSPYKLLINAIDTDIFKTKLLSPTAPVSNWLHLSNPSMYEWPEKYKDDEEYKQTFIDNVRRCFYVTDATNNEKSFSFTVKTDNNPYTVHTWYKSEKDEVEELPFDENEENVANTLTNEYRICDKDVYSDKEIRIRGMAIPTITYKDDAKFGGGTTVNGNASMSKDRHGVEKGFYYVGCIDEKGNELPDGFTSDNKDTAYRFPTINKTFEIVNTFGWSNFHVGGTTYSGYVVGELLNGFPTTNTGAGTSYYESEFETQNDKLTIFTVGNITNERDIEDAVPTKRLLSSEVSSDTFLPVGYTGSTKGNYKKYVLSEDVGEEISLGDRLGNTTMLYTSKDMAFDSGAVKVTSSVIKTKFLGWTRYSYVMLYDFMNAVMNNNSDNDKLNFWVFEISSDDQYPLSNASKIYSHELFKVKSLVDRYGAPASSIKEFSKTGDDSIADGSIKRFYYVAENADGIRTISALYKFRVIKLSLVRVSVPAGLDTAPAGKYIGVHCSQAKLKDAQVWIESILGSSATELSSVKQYGMYKSGDEWKIENNTAAEGYNYLLVKAENDDVYNSIMTDITYIGPIPQTPTSNGNVRFINAEIKKDFKYVKPFDSTGLEIIGLPLSDNGVSFTFNDPPPPPTEP